MTTAPDTIARPSQLALFFDLIKIAHSVFALPFALIATFWAFRTATIRAFSAAGLGRLGLILACMVFARTWAMTFNRLVDRHFDAANPRTAKRPSVTGAVSVPFMHHTLLLCAFLFAVAAGMFQFLYANPWPLVMTIPVLGWLCLYSFTKRFTALCHFWLGASLGLAPVCAWVAIAGGFYHDPLLDPRGLTILLLAGGVTFWVAGFDILYALQDEAFDRSEKLHSIPAALGRSKAIGVSRLCHFVTAIAFFAVGITGHFHALFWVGYAAAVVLLIVEQALVSPRDISKINLAFMTTNGLIGLIFGVLAIADTLF